MSFKSKADRGPEADATRRATARPGDVKTTSTVHVFRIIIDTTTPHDSSTKNHTFIALRFIILCLFKLVSGKFLILQSNNSDLQDSLISSCMLGIPGPAIYDQKSRPNRGS